MRRRVGVLLNPTSGVGGARTSIVAMLTDRLGPVDVIAGRSAPEAGDLLEARMAEGLDVLVAVGGDGTVHQALQVVAGTDTALGIVPMGTGNDAARAIGLPTRAVSAAVDVIAGGTARAFDTGHVGTADGATRHFLCVLSTGFDSLVNERANRMRWPRGQARYVLAMLAELRTFHAIDYRMTVDGEPADTEAMIVSIGNGPSYGGGMRVCPNADMHDGSLSMVWMSRMSRTQLLRTFPKVYSGRHLDSPHIHERSVREVVLDAPGQVAYADGERIGPLPATVRVAPAAVRVLVPAPG